MTSTRFTVALRAAFALAGLLGCAGCQENPNPLGLTQSGTIVGRLIDAGSEAPIAEATIYVGSSVHTLAASDRGGFALSGVPIGTQTLTIDAVGYTEPTTLAVLVAGGKTSDVGLVRLIPMGAQTQHLIPASPAPNATSTPPPEP